MPSIKIALICFAAAAALSTAGTALAADSGNGSGAKLTNCGVEYIYPKTPVRAIVASDPSLENLLALGVEDKIHGVVTSGLAFGSDTPWAAKKAGIKLLESNGGDVSQEALLADEPDFVYSIFSYDFTAQGAASRDTLTSFGIPSYLSPTECAGQEAVQTSSATFETLFSELTDLADIFDVEAEGDRVVADLRARLDAAREKARSLGGVSMLWWYAATAAPYVGGCCGVPAMLTEAVGGTNVYGDQPTLWPEGSWEVIADRDPDVLILGDLPRGGDGDSVEAKIAFLESDPVTSAMSAVKNKRYIILPGIDLDPSARTVFALERLVDALVAFKAQQQ